MAYTFNKEKTFKGSVSLPVGGYVCKIVAAPKYQKWNDTTKKYEEVAQFEYADRTVVPFDIIEGEYQGYFQKKYNDDDSADKKWKGILYLKHPSDSDKYDTNERRYNAFGSALMESNPSFNFNINQNASCNGKLIGIVCRAKEFKMQNGEIGTFAEPYTTQPVDVIRSGEFKLPKAYKLKEDNSSVATSSEGYVEVPGDMEEIPFA